MVTKSKKQILDVMDNHHVNALYCKEAVQENLSLLRKELMPENMLTLRERKARYAKQQLNSTRLS